jgi:hypothetical protein
MTGSNFSRAAFHRRTVLSFGKPKVRAFDQLGKQWLGTTLTPIRRRIESLLLRRKRRATVSPSSLFYNPKLAEQCVDELEAF